MMGKVPLFSPGSTVSFALPGYVALCLALQVHSLVSGPYTIPTPVGEALTLLQHEKSLVYQRTRPPSIHYTQGALFRDNRDSV
ncbi:unnamed protein product [Lepidochelys kempii]